MPPNALDAALFEIRLVELEDRAEGRRGKESVRREVGDLRFRERCKDRGGGSLVAIEQDHADLLFDLDKGRDREAQMRGKNLACGVIELGRVRHLQDEPARSALVRLGDQAMRMRVQQREHGLALAASRRVLVELGAEKQRVRNAGHA